MEDEIGRVCSTKREKENTYTILEGKPEGKRLLGKHRSKWENKTK
jgi:hypothetical protein